MVTDAAWLNRDYTLGSNDELLAISRGFTAEAQAAHLLGQLRPGQRVLDLGCGFGAISVGLAQAVAPGGELHGIDIGAAQVEQARKLAAAAGCGNATFQVADALELPFADDFFDVVHCHSVLSYIPDTGAALREAWRALKPGGVIACREMICESCLICPDFGILRRAYDMFEDLLATDDGHPQMGKEIKGHLIEAGFAVERVSAAFDVYTTPEEVELMYTFADRWLLSPTVAEVAKQYGAVSEELLSNLRSALRKWREHPGAWAAFARGEVVARKPGARDGPP